MKYTLDTISHLKIVVKNDKDQVVTIALHWRGEGWRLYSNDLRRQIGLARFKREIIAEVKNIALSQIGHRPVYSVTITTIEKQAPPSK